jgi:hypothetical protein
MPGGRVRLCWELQPLADFPLPQKKPWIDLKLHNESSGCWTSSRSKGKDFCVYILKKFEEVQQTSGVRGEARAVRDGPWKQGFMLNRLFPIGSRQWNKLF